MTICTILPACPGDAPAPTAGLGAQNTGVHDRPTHPMPAERSVAPAPHRHERVPRDCEQGQIKYADQYRGTHLRTEHPPGSCRNPILELKFGSMTSTATTAARVDELVGRASERTGLDDLGPDSWRDGLGILVETLETAPAVTPEGRDDLYRQFVDALANECTFVQNYDFKAFLWQAFMPTSTYSDWLLPDGLW